MKQSKLPIFVAISAILVIGLFLILYFVTREAANKAVSSYEECVEQGNQIQLSEPPQCIDQAGNTFMDSRQDREAPTNDSSQSDEPTAKSKPSSENSTQETLDIAVYFSKKRESDSDFNDTKPVTRRSSRVDIGAYTIEQLIEGPRAEEASHGLFSPLRGKLSGDSNCSGKDFSLAVAKRTATLKFCRAVKTGGLGDDARIRSTVEDTLRQFSTVENVTILNRDGNCFGDASGKNACLRS